eukprot:CAMPEP_0114666080 /NCGR_PEP_ID=MMETSP0191-20121206/31946_1 /TAXON_ID=126664 /ORGANISM="Sorites sp." /LENGTH=122 /DNA_ID=CAMNT_0001912857 /DNA_START=212 /DNA_END=580 /DNA_ORIENTATION=+
MTMLDILKEITSVRTTITIRKGTFAMHRIFGPLTSVTATICPCIGTTSAHVVGFEIAGVAGSIWPQESAFTMFHALVVGALESLSIWPNLYSVAMMLVTPEAAGVFGAVHIHGDSIAMLHVV